MGPHGSLLAPPQGAFPAATPELLGVRLAFTWRFSSLAPGWASTAFSGVIGAALRCQRFRAGEAAALSLSRYLRRLQLAASDELWSSKPSTPTWKLRAWNRELSLSPRGGHGGPDSPGLGLSMRAQAPQGSGGRSSELGLGLPRPVPRPEAASIAQVQGRRREGRRVPRTQPGGFQG